MHILLGIINQSHDPHLLDAIPDCLLSGAAVILYPFLGNLILSCFWTLVPANSCLTF